jgi:hypothetical protein
MSSETDWNATAARMPDGSTVLAHAAAGTNAVILWQTEDQTRIGSVLDGSDPNTNWEATDLERSVPADGFTVRTGGQFTEAENGGFFSMVGQSGADVLGIDVANPEGDTVAADIFDGHFAVAWMGDDFDPEGKPSFVLHLDNGTDVTHEYPADPQD